MDLFMLYDFTMQKKKNGLKKRYAWPVRGGKGDFYIFLNHRMTEAQEKYRE